jgi:hypothetical protein
MNTVEAFLLITSGVIAVFTVTALVYEFWVDDKENKDES